MTNQLVITEVHFEVVVPNKITLYCCPVCGIRTSLPFDAIKGYVGNPSGGGMVQCPRCLSILRGQDMTRISSPTTKFPRKEIMYWDGEHCGGWYFPDEIDDWLKRCKNDFPMGDNITHSPVQSLVFYRWFEKWFSQLTGVET